MVYSIANNGASGESGRPPGGKRTGARRKAGKQRSDLYQEVTDKIIAELEVGSFPWVQPWSLGQTALACGLPKNAHTGNTYSGINILLLWASALETERTTQTWLTYRQAQEMGGHVRKGERGSMVVYANTFIPKAEAERAQQTGDSPESIGFLKRYRVFNADQCEGLPEDVYKDVSPVPERKTIPRAEALIEATGADFRIGGDKAFYVPSQDFIQIPPQQAYFEQINYYRTAFHELGHWTAHPSRLDRKTQNKKGGKDYAREELVAEMATAFVCASLGIQPTVRHTDYIAGWLEVLRNDKRAIFRAASLASKAADYILNCAPDAAAHESRCAA